MARNYQQEYKREQVISKRYNTKLMLNTDSDIIEVLDKQTSKQGFIKSAIRYYIANGCPEMDSKEEKEGDQK